MPELEDRTTTAPVGLERWLTSRPRLVLVAILAAATATAATSMGELELLRASDMITDHAERSVVVQSGAIWLTWALVSPLLLAIAFQLARGVGHWTIALLCHLPLAFGVGCAFLAGEIMVQEAAQGPEDTDLFRRILDRRDGARERAGSPEARRGRGAGQGTRREGLTDRSGGAAPRQLGPPGGVDRPGSGNESLSGAPDEGIQPAAGRRQRSEDTDRETRRARFTRDDFRRLRRTTIRTTANVATGNFPADFERRWRLRVPRYGLVYMVIVLIGLGSRAFLIGRQREREAALLALRAERLEAELVEARLTSLRSQLHPHFLFNALHSVGGLIRSDAPGHALTALDQIGDLLRTSLDAGGEQFVPLGREFELVRRYLDVEALRLGEKLRVELVSDPALEECEVPAFITQPLVENAVKHGVTRRTGGGLVAITARAIEGEILEIIIENEGPAPPAAPDEGIGLAHVRTRLETLFEGAGSLHLEERSEAEGARAVLRLPLDDPTSEVEVREA